MKTLGPYAKRTAGVVLLAVVAGLAGCGQAATSPAAPSTASTALTLTDGAGRTVKLPAVPQRVVSLSPAATDMLVTVNAHAQIVGATRYCKIPAEDESHVTRIGGVMDPDFEGIVALKPDLVIAPWLADKTLQDKLTALGLPVLVLHPEGLQGVIDDIRLVGRATGNEVAGDTKAKAIENIRALTESRWKGVPPEKHPRVLIYMDDSCPAPGSYVDDLLTAAGGRNVLPPGNKAWVQVTPESALELAPDLIIEIRSDEESATEPSKPAYQSPTRLVTLPQGEVFYHPGPGVGQALWDLARAIDPARFPEATPPITR